MYFNCYVDKHIQNICFIYTYQRKKIPLNFHDSPPRVPWFILGLEIFLFLLLPCRHRILYLLQLEFPGPNDENTNIYQNDQNKYNL